jgi:hypothetical protein
MARVTGVKEKVHSPLYDAFFVPESEEEEEDFSASMTDPRMLRFFVDVQNKTRLETNLQNAGQLPSLNSFEARAMRVVIDAPAPSGDDDEGITSAEFTSLVIFNSVSSLIVGEKVMLEVPTFWLPGGSGVQVGDGTVSNHGVPDPMATFRFAEPVAIEPQQNFRVEMLFPNDVPEDVGTARGPIRIWVALDGYYTRDVQ